MMRKISLLMVVLFISFLGYSQSYQTALGAKWGNVGGGFSYGYGLNIKHFFAGSNALEATVGLGRHHFNAQALYEWQKELDQSIGLDWYVGLGGTLGTWRGEWDDHPVFGDGYNRGFYLGANAVVGLDWNLERITSLPLGLALDVGPYLGVINSGYWGWNGAFAIRYIIN